jgi:hypothetical protein
LKTHETNAKNQAQYGRSYMRAFVFLLIFASCKVFAFDTKNNFDPNEVVNSPASRNLKYKLNTCIAGTGPSEAWLNWQFGIDGKIEEIVFDSLTFTALFPVHRTTFGHSSAVIENGVIVNVYDSGILVSSSELLFNSGITQLQFKQKYFTGGSLDCNYKLTNNPSF